MTERLTAIMQFSLSVIFTIGYFGVVAVVLFGVGNLNDAHIRLADTLFGVLSAVLASQSAYWFSRQRGNNNGSSNS